MVVRHTLVRVIEGSQQGIMRLELALSHLSSCGLIEIKWCISFVVHILTLTSIERMSLTHLLACEVPNMIEAIQIMDIVETVEHIIWNEVSLVHFSICSISSCT